MNQPASIAWFGRHEIRLFWRDFVAMLTAGNRRRERLVLGVTGIFVLAIHGLAFAVLNPVAANGIDVNAPTLLVISGSIAISFVDDLVAGNGVGHPRFLCPVRSRSDFIVAGFVTAAVRSTHGRGGHL